MATLARRAGKTDDIARYKMLAQKAQGALKANFVDSQMTLAGSLEKLAQGANYRDGSTVEAIAWSLVDPGTDLVASSTLSALSYLQTPAGGYKRIEGSTDPYDTNEWILIDLRASQQGKADQLLDWVTAQASVNYNLLPELYNTISSAGPIGAYAGSIPMVGYGAGAYVMTMLDRAQLYEHADCGDKDIGQYPDAGAVVGPHGDGGTNADAGGRTGIACACSGGAGSSGNAAMLVVVALVVRRRRRP
jgi:MYXO-CTERM domain-containing protein